MSEGQIAGGRARRGPCALSVLAVWERMFHFICFVCVSVSVCVCVWIFVCFICVFVFLLHLSLYFSGLYTNTLRSIVYHSPFSVGIGVCIRNSRRAKNIRISYSYSYSYSFSGFAQSQIQIHTTHTQILGALLTSLLAPVPASAPHETKHIWLAFHYEFVICKRR